MSIMVKSARAALVLVAGAFWLGSADSAGAVPGSRGSETAGQADSQATTQFSTSSVSPSRPSDCPDVDAGAQDSKPNNNAKKCGFERRR